MMTTFAWIGAGMAGGSLGGFCERWSGIDAGRAPKATNPSLKHLASYARIAIQIGKISRER
jgi:hypothetical protein